MAGRFGDEGKSRVAHRPVHNAQLLEALERKRLSLAAITAKVSGSPTKRVVPAASRGTVPKKRKEFIASDDEGLGDFVVDDEESEADDFNLSDEEPKKRKKVAVACKPKVLSATRDISREKTPIVKIKLGNETVIAQGKPRTLSESSNDEVDGWMCKPRLDAEAKKPNNKMKTRVSDPPKKSKKKITLSDESEEDLDNAPSASTLKKVAKAAQKHKNASRGEFSEDEDEEAEADLSDRRESTPSEDSDADERRGRRNTSEDPISAQCRQFFNTASQEELLATPRVTEKIALQVIGNRPFNNFSQLEDCVSEVSRGKQALEAYHEYLENRGVLENIMDDCRGHAQSIENDFESCTRNKFQPSSLAPGYNLHEYQQVGLNWLIMMHKKGFNCILGDEMGLGKTIQVIAFLAWLKESKVKGPHLIVVPSSTVENWMGEITRWCPDLKLLTYYGSQDERKQLRHMAKKRKDSIDVVLTTYNMISSKHDDKKFFKNFSMHYVIYDEGHMLKNCSTDRYKNLMKVKGLRKILMTGTPLQNNLIELISLMYFTMTKIFTKYCEDITQLLSHFKQQGGPALESSGLAMYQKDRIEQAKQLLQPYILRRLKAQVLSNLPAKLEEIVEVDMLDKQNDHYEYILDTVRNMGGEPSNAQGALMKLRQAANHPLLRRTQYDDAKLNKIAKVLVAKEKPYEKKQWEHVAEDLEYMSDFQLHQLCEKFRSTQKFLLDACLALESGKCQELDKRLPIIKEKGEKVLIFSQFTSMLDILEVYLRVRGHEFRRLDGQTPVMERQEMINEFNSDGSLFVFLLSTKAGGLGINLTSANHIIIHDIDFNPYNDKQAEDRCHRMGQKREVFVTRLISKGTVETGILSLARKKLQLEKQVTGGIKGQLEDDEETRDSSDSREEKLDSKVLQDLLSSAMKHKRVEDTTPSPTPSPV